MNKVYEDGFVGKYVNIGTARNGAKFVSFQLSQKTGKDTRQYLPVVAWNNDNSKLADYAEMSVKPGNYCMVQGHLNVKKTGDGKTETSVIADTITSLEYHQREVAPPTPQPPVREPMNTATPLFTADDIDPNDLPF